MELKHVACFITVWVACAAAKDEGLPQWYRYTPGFHTLLPNKEAIVRPMINLAEIQAELSDKNLEELVLFADKMIIDKDISLPVSTRTVIICGEMLVNARSTPNVNFGKGQVDVVINQLKGLIMLSSQAIANKEDLIKFLSTKKANVDDRASDLFLPRGEFVPETVLHGLNYIITAFEINLRSNTDIESILKIHASIANLVTFLRSAPRVHVYDILRKRLLLILQINPDTDLTPIIPLSGTKQYEPAIETSLRAALHYLSSIPDSETNEDKNETIMANLERLNDQFKQGASIIRSATSNLLKESIQRMTWLYSRLKRQSGQLILKRDKLKNTPLVVNAMKWLVSLPLGVVEDCAVEDVTTDKELKMLLWRLCSTHRSAVTVQKIKLDKVPSREVDSEMTRQMQAFDREHRFDFPIEIAWEQIESRFYSLLNPSSTDGPQLENFWGHYKDILAILKESFELSSRIKTLMIELTQLDLWDSFFHNSVDISTENILQQRELFMVQRLSNVLHFHDTQIQYDHLQTKVAPVTIVFSSMLRELDLRLKTMQKRQEKKLNTSLKTVRYDIEVPLNELFSDIGMLHRIPLSAPEFKKLAMVRIRGVSLELAGVNKTFFPDVHMELTSSGYVYFDRSASGSTFEFSSLDKIFPLTETNGKWSYDANDERDFGTPFTEWIIRAKTTAASTITRSPNMVKIQMTFKVRVQMTALQPTVVKRSVSRSQILGEMKDNGITNGYDVVCSMTASKLNTLFKQRYDQIDHAGLAYNITTDRILRSSNTIPTPVGDMVVKEYLSINAIVGPPLISFLANEPKRAQVHMEVLSGWKLKTVESTFQGKVTKQNFKTILESTPGKRPTIKAKVPLKYFRGSVSNHNDVVLRFAEGAFDSENFDIDFADKVDMANKLKGYFIDHHTDMTYSLGTLIYNTKNTPKYLQPTSFLFAGEKYGSDPGGVLSLYILTDHNDAAFRKFSRRETLDSVSRPMPSDKSASLIISSFVFMKLMVLPQLKSQLGMYNNLEVRNRNRGQAFFVSGKNKYNFGSTLLGYREEGDKYYHVYRSLDLDLTNLTARTNGQDFCINYFTYMKGHTANMLRKPWTGFPKIEDFSLDGTSVTISDCCTSFQVDSQQVISVKSSKTCASSIDNFPTPKDAKVTLADFLSAGLVRAIEHLLQNQKKELNTAVRSSIQGRIKIPKIHLRDVSVFAVSNLLFPNSKILDFQEVYTPGDMVVFGTVRDKI